MPAAALQCLPVYIPQPLFKPPPPQLVCGMRDMCCSSQCCHYSTAFPSAWSIRASPPSTSICCSRRLLTMYCHPQALSWIGFWHFIRDEDNFHCISVWFHKYTAHRHPKSFPSLPYPTAITSRQDTHVPTLPGSPGQAQVQGVTTPCHHHSNLSGLAACC